MSSAPEPNRFSHVVASRDGLFLVGRTAFRKLTEGLFFGLTVRDREIFVFEAGDQPWVESWHGRIVRYGLEDGALTSRQVMAEGLDNGCHQIDFVGESLIVLDTYNQTVLEFDPDWRLSVHHPLPPARYGAWSAGYVHMNSLLARGGRIWLLLHNGGRAPSEVLEVDRDFAPLHRFALPGDACHDVVELEDGELLVCDSPRGGLITRLGPAAQIDALLTRGLSVGRDEIAVGSSLFGERPVRALAPGFVTFLDRAYRRVGRLHLPAAPTQIRRLDGADLSLSEPWGLG
jgi:hypothetical protein